MRETLAAFAVAFLMGAVLLSLYAWRVDQITQDVVTVPMGEHVPDMGNGDVLVITGATRGQCDRLGGDWRGGGVCHGVDY